MATRREKLDKISDMMQVLLQMKMQQDMLDDRAGQGYWGDALAQAKTDPMVAQNILASGGPMEARRAAAAMMPSPGDWLNTATSNLHGTTELSKLPGQESYVQQQGQEYQSLFNRPLPQVIGDHLGAEHDSKRGSLEHLHNITNPQFRQEQQFTQGAMVDPVHGEPMLDAEGRPVIGNVDVQMNKHLIKQFGGDEEWISQVDFSAEGQALMDGMVRHGVVSAELAAGLAHSMNYADEIAAIKTEELLNKTMTEHLAKTVQDAHKQGTEGLPGISEMFLAWQAAKPELETIRDRWGDDGLKWISEWELGLREVMPPAFSELMPGSIGPGIRLFLELKQANQPFLARMSGHLGNLAEQEQVKAGYFAPRLLDILTPGEAEEKFVSLMALGSSAGEIALVEHTPGLSQPQKLREMQSILNRSKIEFRKHLGSVALETMGVPLPDPSTLVREERPRIPPTPQPGIAGRQQRVGEGLRRGLGLGS